jgi:hypothetical protein
MLSSGRLMKAAMRLRMKRKASSKTTHYTIDCCFLSPPNELAATFGTSRSTASPCRCDSHAF